MKTNTKVTKTKTKVKTKRKNYQDYIHIIKYNKILARFEGGKDEPEIKFELSNCYLRHIGNNIFILIIYNKDYDNDCYYLENAKLNFIFDYVHIEGFVFKQEHDYDKNFNKIIPDKYNFTKEQWSIRTDKFFELLKKQIKENYE